MMDAGNSAAVLVMFAAFLFLSLAALVAACVRGREWGDLSSRRHYGEALTEEEKTALRRSRRSFLIWMGVSLISAALSFFALR